MQQTWDVGYLAAQRIARELAGINNMGPFEPYAPTASTRVVVIYPQKFSDREGRARNFPLKDRFYKHSGRSPRAFDCGAIQRDAMRRVIENLDVPFSQMETTPAHAWEKLD